MNKPEQERISENEEPNKITLKKPPLLNYARADDRWKPLNGSGNKIYDRDFLVKLKNSPHSKIRPVNLPDLEIVLEKTWERSFRGGWIERVLESSSQKSKPRESNNRPAFIDKALSNAIKTDDEKKNVLRTKCELIEEADCRLVKKQPESSVVTSELQNEISIFLDKDSCFSCLNGQLSMEQIHMRLLCIMSDDNENSVDDISDWISENVRQRATESEFIKVLMTAILEVSIEPYNNTWKFRADKFQNLQALIPRYNNFNMKFELQCLIAIQEYNYKLENPPDVLLQIIEKLWDDSILSTDAFLAWERNNDPTALVGKSIAMEALMLFLISLKVCGSLIQRPSIVGPNYWLTSCCSSNELWKE